MSQTLRSRATPWGLALLLVLLFASLVRVVYFDLYTTSIPMYERPLVDAKIYEEWSRDIAAGDWWSTSRGVFYRAPLYPYLLAGLRSVFGALMPALAWVQMAAGLGLLLTVAAMARRIAGPRAATIAAGLLALYGPLVAAESKRLSTSLGLLLLALSLHALLIFYERPGVRRGARAGLMLGLSVLVRPFFLVYAVLAPCLGVFRPLPRWVLLWVPFAVGVCVLVFPVTVRNKVVGDDWVLISSNGGMTFFQGNNVENRSGLLTIIQRFQVFGSAEQQEAMERAVAEEAMGRSLKPSESSRFWAGEAGRFIREHPGSWLRLQAVKAYRVVTSFEYADNYSFYLERERIWPLRLAFVPFGLCLALGALGAIAGPPARPDRRLDTSWRLLVTSAAVGVAGCLLFYVSSRYRMEALPALAVLAGVGVDRILGEGRAWWRGRRHRVAMAVAIVLFGASFLPPGAPARSQESITYLHLGNALESLGRPAEAREAFDRATALLPENPFAWKSLLLATARTEGEEAARARLAEIDAATRSHPELLYVEGYLYAQTGDRERAIDALRRAVDAQPMMREGHARLADLLEESGVYAEAARHLREAVRLRESPDDATLAHVAYLYIQARDYAAARAVASEVAARKPGDRDVALNLAIAEFYLGDLEAAERALTRLHPQGLLAADGQLTDTVAAYYRALLHLHAGECAPAARLFAALVRTQPEHLRALYYGGLAAARCDLQGTPLDASVQDALGIDAWKHLWGPAFESVAPRLRDWLRARAPASWGAPLNSLQSEALLGLEQSAEGRALAERIRAFLEEESTGTTVESR